ncbi:MAG: ABC transporter ATP-binding protein [Alphaproteobacteria bacterium]|nr:ABC transporter ATP-binding protein [Alphaproteobacteria bacterium]
MSAVVKAEALSRRLEGEVPVTLVDHASLEVKKGEFVVINGPSGSGKSSLLYLLGLLDQPTGGRLWLNGVETSAYSEERLAELRLAELGFVFQFHFLLPEFTAIENVMLPMRRLGRLSESAIQARAQELLESLGLGDQSHKLPKQLSGGQSQRVAIARALANEPLLILADEPTGNLDTASSRNVQDILRKLAHERGRSVIAVTHDPQFAETADRIITIVDGRVRG